MTARSPAATIAAVTRTETGRAAPPRRACLAPRSADPSDVAFKGESLPPRIHTTPTQPLRRRLPIRLPQDRVVACFRWRNSPCTAPRPGVTLLRSVVTFLRPSALRLLPRL